MMKIQYFLHICINRAKANKMIVEFSVKNFRSIKELQTISFVATSLDSNQEKYPEVDKNNIADEGGMRLLKTVGIYGPNAGGKSNVVKAIGYFLRAVSLPSSPDSQLGPLSDPFLFQDGAENSETYFQIVMILDGKKYRYGFTVAKQIDSGGFIDSTVVTSEWLFGPKEVNQVKFFTRKGLEVQIDNLPNGKSLPKLQYEHSLFLTHAAAFEKGICASIWDYFRNFTISNVGVNDTISMYALWRLENPVGKASLLSFLANFDLHYDDIEIQKGDGQSLLQAYKQNGLFLIKKNLGANGKSIRLNLNNQESVGTAKLFDLSGLILGAAEARLGGLIILDELDSNFHPSLVRRLVELCNSTAFNKANFQLLFTSHDTTIMNPGIMRRDQFYFAEKDVDFSTRVYSLADLKGVRNDADFARHYLAGFYGSIPYLPSLSNSII